MGFLSKTYNRYRTGDGRLEGDLTPLIEDFFKEQQARKKYEIVDKENWIVDIDGSIELYAEDLYNGELPFKIGKLSGDLYSHVKRLKPSVLPIELGGELIFVRDEEDRPRSKSNGGNDEDNDFLMSQISTAPPSRAKTYKKVEEVIGEIISNGFDFDIEEIKKNLEKEWNNRANLDLTVVITPVGSANNKDVKFYIGGKLLNLTAIEKALYILFILSPDGRLLSVNKEFITSLQNIYSQIKGRVQDDQNGIMGGNFDEKTTLLSCRSQIRKAIKEILPINKIVDDFAIEGEKGGKFSVRKATDNVRNEIRKYFTL